MKNIKNLTKKGGLHHKVKDKVILVIDGLGGGIGKTVIAKLKDVLPKSNIIAIGTNSVAMENMVNSGADFGYVGEENIIKHAKTADIIVGAMGILIPNGLKGELTQNMVTAICASNAVKILIPMNKCGIRVAVSDMPLTHHIDSTIKLVQEELLNS